MPALNHPAPAGSSFSLLPHNSFGLNVFAAEELAYHSADELVGFATSGRIVSPYLHIGQGSNLLFCTHFPGIILRNLISSVQVVEEDAVHVYLRVGGGMVWDELVAYTVQHGWWGIENLSGIPGTVGAAAVQNIGAYGVEVKDCICTVETVDVLGAKRTFSCEECAYSYRQSLFKTAAYKGCFVTHLTLRLSKKIQPNLSYAALAQQLSGKEITCPEQVRQAVLEVRNSKLPDPALLGNAGSFFMNPVVSEAFFARLSERYPDMPHYPAGEGRVKIPAGRLIELCGWKGKSLGRAGVYAKQALVIVNLGGATPEEIVQLARCIKEDVHRLFGITLQPEVLFVGGSL